MERPGTEGRGAKSRNHGPQDQRGGLGLGLPKATRGGWQGRVGEVWGLGQRGCCTKGRACRGPGRPSAYLQPGGDSE